MDPETGQISEFRELYHTRESLRAQQAEATEATVNLYDSAIDTANSRLTELAQNPEVEDYLTKLGGVVARSLLELKEIEETGLIDEQVLEGKRQEIERLQDDPSIRMALEFLTPQHLPEAAPVRLMRFASQGQIEFARSLGLEITDETPRGLASKMITQEVKRRSRAELKAGDWEVFMLVDHPKHGRCEIAKIHEKIGKVTLKPFGGGRSFVVSAMYLPGWSPNG